MVNLGGIEEIVMCQEVKPNETQAEGAAMKEQEYCPKCGVLAVIFTVAAPGEYRYECGCGNTWVEEEKPKERLALMVHCSVGSVPFCFSRTTTERNHNKVEELLFREGKIKVEDEEDVQEIFLIDGSIVDHWVPDTSEEIVECGRCEKKVENVSIGWQCPHCQVVLCVRCLRKYEEHAPLFHFEHCPQCQNLVEEKERPGK